MFLFHDIGRENSTIANEQSIALKEDVTALSELFEEMFKRTKIEIQADGKHLLESLSDEEMSPPCEAILYHPFFWFEDEMIAFLQSADEFCDNNNNCIPLDTVKLNETVELGEMIEKVQRKLGISALPTTIEEAITCFTTLVCNI